MQVTCGRQAPSARDVAIYDPITFRNALGETEWDEFVGLEVEKPAKSRTTEDEIWARCIEGVLADPRGHLRPHLMGEPTMLKQLARVSAASPHFDAVTGIIQRAVTASVVTGQPLRFPPILMLSPPGIGKTYFCRSVAGALGTTCVPISINGTSDRGQLGGLTSLWRGAKMGRIAKALLVDSATASPLFLLDELDKAPSLVSGENTLDVLLSLLEEENARAFVDEYVGLPICAQHANWIASANTTRTISDALLDRVLTVEISAPAGEHAKRVVRSIASDLIERRTAGSVEALDEEAVANLAGLNARKSSRIVDLAIAFAISDRRSTITAEDIARARALVDGHSRSARIGFLSV